MTGISAWFPLMVDTVTVAAAGSRDGYGDITYGSATSYRARVVGQQKLIRGFSGQEVVSRHTVYLGAAVEVQPDARVRLSSGYVNSTEDSALFPPVLGTARYPDTVGLHHTVIYLG